MMKESGRGWLHATRRNFLKTASVGLLGLGKSRGAQAQAAADGGERAMNNTSNVVIYLYDRMTVLDAIGPYEVLRCVPDAKLRFVARRAGLVRPDSGLQMLNAEYGIDDVDSADILVIPGGDPTGPMGDKDVLAWVRHLHGKTKWTTSVCTGSLILGAAGLLKGVQATTYWNNLENLKMFGAEPVSKRFVRQGKVITAAGVSAGIDMALSLVALEHGEEMAQTIQLLIEYDPQPPFNADSRGKASPAMIERARKMLAALYSRPRR
jgi:transcriptional regulator GlxA family with amidase domain